MRLVAPLLLLGILAARSAGREINLDLRGQEVDESLFRLVGAGAQSRIRSEPQGLRITMPGDAKPATLGLHSRFHLFGDFAVTVGYELLAMERPTKGSGVGLEIYLNTKTPREDALVLYRIVRPKEGEVFMCDRKWTVDGKRHFDRQFFPAGANSGRLRLSRIGTMVAFQEERPGGEFHELCSHDWGDMEVTGLAARAWGSEKSVDLRLTEIRVRDQGEPLAVTSPSAVSSEEPARRSSTPLWLVIGVLAAAGLGAGLLVIRRRLARLLSAADASQTELVAFFCSRCGKALKATAAASGKAVSCPGCAESVLVPERRPNS